MAYTRFALTHNARLLGSVQGVVVHATRAALSASPTIGKDTITAGSGTVYDSIKDTVITNCDNRIVYELNQQQSQLLTLQSRPASKFESAVLQPVL